MVMSAKCHYYKQILAGLLGDQNKQKKNNRAPRPHHHHHQIRNGGLCACTVVRLDKTGAYRHSAMETFRVVTTTFEIQRFPRGQDNLVLHHKTRPGLEPGLSFLFLTKWSPAS
jgi:hypothetical protein